MCGLAGFASRRDALWDQAEIHLARMTDAIRHRGPDDGGSWMDKGAGVALGFRRLSIVDLSPAGHQPMVSQSGRFVIVFNGEIYNHAELRRQLQCEGMPGGVAAARQAPIWRGHSDTETLLAAIEAWGIRAALTRTVGMFAIAVWDRQAAKLHLARDRMGEKPLYYGWCKGDFLFASELKAFAALPDFAPAIDRDALTLYFRHGNVPAPWTIYERIFKLRPGHLMSVDMAGGRAREDAASEPYWSLVETSRRADFAGSERDAVDELERLLMQSIEAQKVADVPVGAFLSGGIDSSAVVAIMQSVLDRPVRTFSIGFAEAEFNEAASAAAVAKHLGTDHTELILSPGDALALVPRLPEIWDEPFADSSQIPTALVASLARRDVTVSLTGDGGDELFCGYSHYARADLVERIPARAALGWILSKSPKETLAGLARRIPLASARAITAHRLDVVAAVLAAPTPVERHLERMLQPQANRAFLREGLASSQPLVDVRPSPELDYGSTLSMIDALTYLPDDILVKVDRAAMATSLEPRAPLLDHRIVEFAFALPQTIKVRGGVTKWPLREVLYRYAPRHLFERPKKGFGVPIAAWLRGPLRDWAEDLLSAPSLEATGQLDVAYVSGLWRDHLSGKHNAELRLWRVLMFCAWWRRYG